MNAKTDNNINSKNVLQSTSSIIGLIILSIGTAGCLEVEPTKDSVDSLSEAQEEAIDESEEDEDLDTLLAGLDTFLEPKQEPQARLRSRVVRARRGGVLRP